MLLRNIRCYFRFDRKSFVSLRGMAMVLFYIFVLCSAIQCCYILFLFSRILLYKPAIPDLGSSGTPVSVIICAHNEAENLSQHLPLILNQDYFTPDGQSPAYEVIVVNDRSTDATDVVLEELKGRYDHLKTISIAHTEPRTFPGKKDALSRGVRIAENEWLLLTDGDCQPSSPSWIAKMTGPLSQGKDIVAGFGGFYREQHAANLFTRLETVHTLLQYATYTLAGRPYMAVGRNMACRKQLLAEVMNRDAWKLIPSGDDDLLISEMSNKRNMAVVIHPDAFTYSRSRKDLGSWLAQKKRHLSTGKLYKASVKLLLGTYAASHAVLWVTFIAVLFTAFFKTALFLFALRFLLMLPAWIRINRLTKGHDLIPLLPVFDFGWLVYNFILSPYIFWKNKLKWT